MEIAELFIRSKDFFQIADCYDVDTHAVKKWNSFHCSVDGFKFNFCKMIFCELWCRKNTYFCILYG